MFLVLKSLHILGTILFLGNILVTGWWKVRADRHGDPRVVAFAQRLVALNDFLFTSTGVALILGSGIMITALYRVDYLEQLWYAWGYWLFIASAVVWFGLLIPVQRKQCSLARGFAHGGPIPPLYWRLERIWLTGGVIALLLPLANLYWMVFKPL